MSVNINGFSVWESRGVFGGLAYIQCENCLESLIIDLRKKQWVPDFCDSCNNFKEEHEKNQKPLVLKNT